MKLRLSGSTAGSIKLSVQQRTIKDTDPSLDAHQVFPDGERKWDFPKPMIARTQDKFFKAFKQQVLPIVEKELREALHTYLPQGLIFYIEPGMVDPKFIPALKKYKDALKGYVTGAGLPRLVNLATKGEKGSPPSKTLQDVINRLGKALGVKNLLEEYENVSVSKLIAELDQKIKLDPKNQELKTLRRTVEDNTSRLLSKTMEVSPRARGILGDAGVGEAELKSIVDGMVSSKLKAYTEDDDNLKKLTNTLVKLFMQKAQGTLGNAKNIMARGVRVDNPQDFIDEMFTNVLVALQKEAHRMVGVRKGDKSPGEKTLLPIFTSYQPNFFNHMFFVVEKRIEDFIKPDLAESQATGRKGREGELNPTKEFLEEGDAFRSAQVPNWVDFIPDMRKNFAEALEDLEQEKLFAEDLHKLFSSLSRLKGVGDKELSKKAERALLAIPAVAAVMSHYSENPGLLNEVNHMAKEFEKVVQSKAIKKDIDLKKLMELVRQKGGAISLSDVADKDLHSYFPKDGGDLDMKTIRQKIQGTTSRERGWSFEPAQELLHKVLPLSKSILKSQNALRNAFQKGDVAEALATILSAEAGRYKSDIFKDLISNVGKVKADPKGVSRDVFVEQKKVKLPSTKSKENVVTEEEDDAELPAKTSSVSRDRSGSTFLKKLYRDFLRS